jgi:hypothetical protein
MNGSLIFLYSLILAIVVALLLSFLQLSKTQRTFVPQWKRVKSHKGLSLDQLLGELCRKFHVLGLYKCDADDPDALFMTINKGDLLLTVPIATPEIPANELHYWKLHPFSRTHRVSQQEKQFIQSQWMKVIAREKKKKLKRKNHFSSAIKM